MLQRFGVICLVLAVCFETGLFISNARFIWFQTNEHPWFGFIGFGIPMLGFGLAVGAVWNGMNGPLRLFAWICALSSLIWAAGLFVTVGRWVGLLPIDHETIGFWEAIASFLAFAIPLTAVGGTAFGILQQIKQPGEN